MLAGMEPHPKAMAGDPAGLYIVPQNLGTVQGYRPRVASGAALRTGLLKDGLQQDITTCGNILWGSVLNFVMTNTIFTGDENHR
jgi:hypothetical protein